MAFADGGPRAVCGALGHPRGPRHSAVPALHDPPLITKERPGSLSLESTGIFIKITVHLLPSGSDFNLSVL